MRVLVVNVRYSPESFGGATQIAEETARGLMDRGHDVVVFTGTYDSHLPMHGVYRYEDRGIPVVAVRVPGDEGQYDAPGITAQFERALDVIRPDVVHAHSLQSLGVGPVAAAQRRDIPTVVTAHDAWWLCERQFMVRQTGEYCGQTAIRPEVCATCVPDAVRHEGRQRRSLSLLNRCDLVLAPSAFLRDLLVASGVGPDIAAVNPNGVSRPPAGWRRTPYSGPVRIGYVGGRNPVKGYPQLLAALQSMDRSDYLLRVVDSYSNLGLSTMTPADWAVPGQVDVVSGYSADTTDAFFDSIDVLAFPSQAKESYGLTVREAVLRGVWPILTDGGGADEAIVPGVNGSVVARAGGATDLAVAIAAYLDASPRPVPDPRACDGVPTFAQQVAELEALLSDVVARRGGKA